METELTTTMALPLDPDGFLRRRCGACQLEFKWLYSDDPSEIAPVPDGGYHCPYCDSQADPSSWFTAAQVRLAEQITATELAPKFLQSFADESGLTYKPGPQTEVEEIGSEPNDMRRVDFPCHPNEPIKVAEDWHEPSHCAICGESSSAP